MEWLLIQLYRIHLLSFSLSLLSGNKHCPPSKKDIKIDTEGDEGSNVLEGQWKVEDTDTNLRWYDGNAAVKQRWEDSCGSFFKNWVTKLHVNE